MGAEWPPAPPDGYRLHDPEYDQPWYVTTFLFLWLVSVFAGVPALVLGVHGLDTAIAIVRALQPDGMAEWVVYLGWTAGTLGIWIGGHELLHALVARQFELRTRFDIQYDHLLDWRPAVVTYGEFQSRSQSLAITLAPLVVFTPISIVAIVTGQDLWVIASGAVIALGNSAGSVGDLASAWVVCHLPEGELLYHDREGRRQYYKPTNGN